MKEKEKKKYEQSWEMTLITQLARELMIQETLPSLLYSKRAGHIISPSWKMERAHLHL